jgi:hypothetical protein
MDRNFMDKHGFLDHIFGWFLGYDSGSFHLRHGEHDLFVPTRIVPKAVWVKCVGHGHDACGQNPQNWVCYEPQNDGILFYVKVNTHKCFVEWFATA